ncbi:MAG: GTPase-activating protein [Gammaproteobacteria bacterium]|nr:GTPase-activating protein [Gammaproteobacteria bacterium]
MTRQKKSRKIGQIGVRKQDARPEKPKQDIRRKKAPKGQKSGSRNSLVEEKSLVGSTTEGSGPKKNSKLGSKKPIDLLPKQKAVQAEKPIQHSTKKPEVVLKRVKQDTITPEQELAQLENDEKLIELAERVEQGELLTGKDAKYFNKHMARFDELLDILGIEDESEQDEKTDEVDNLDANQWDDLLK